MSSKTYTSRRSEAPMRRIMVLEFSQYLENYLWPNYSHKATHAHIMSIVIMLNEKFRERVQVWQAFKENSQHFPHFFEQVLNLSVERDELLITIKEQTSLLVFVNRCFNSMEEPICRDQVKRLVSLSMWVSLQSARRDSEFRRCPKWEKYWKAIQKKDKPEMMEKLMWERTLLHKMMCKFMEVLDSIPEEGPIMQEKVLYCERFLEFVTDLEALLLTRRFFNTVLDDCHLVVRCQLSNLSKRPEGHLFRQLLDMLKFYARFEISDVTGDPLTDHDMTELHYNNITSLQKAAFAKFPDLRNFSLANVASVDSRESLQKHFSNLSVDKLRAIGSYLHLVPTTENEKDAPWCRTDEQFLKELLISRHEKRISQLDSLNEMPLYPTEEIIWNENVVPTAYFSGEGCLALPKLNLQFLTLHDYLLRNFNLFRLESTYEIRQDIEDAVSRLCPWKAEDESVYWGGWARMAQPIVTFAVVEVSKPNIGEKRPSRVRADVTVNLSVRPEIKAEWENLRKHDVCFLITVIPVNPIGTKYDYKNAFIPQVGLHCVRGCEVEGMLDSNGRVIEDGPEPKPAIPGDKRTYRVWLDCNQYRDDMNLTNQGGEDVYEGFNIFMRRKPKENNFKAVLETIRELMNTECVVPDWLHDIILGYGDPGAAHYSRMPDTIPTMDFNDTFIDAAHLRSCFPNRKITYSAKNREEMPRPFKITFDRRKDDQVKEEEKEVLTVESHKIPKRGPYTFNEPKKNSIPFTPTQVEAIRAGMQPGLTLVVGPPGTGKTDVAVQIISNLYHNFPNQRTLIVTHSNQALNQLFEKIASLDIDERHLLRLGHGEEALETEKDFSRYGRVNYVLAKRLDLLSDVQRLQESLEVKGDVAYTCETAGHFYLYQILSRWEQYQSVVRPKGVDPGDVSLQRISEDFPFSKFFENAPQPLFKGASVAEDLDIADSCFRYIQHIFNELEEFRAFELLRSGLDRSKYLLVKEAKIIAMTCTHAALKRKELVDMGFKYDNILMEESAQILEIETFIPLLLQNPQDGYNRLKRWIMIGDHHQLPPVIKNMAFQKYSNMEQSLFTRLVRLGVPTVDLDGQGRARPSICDLYKWRYKNLGNLEHVYNRDEYKSANAGLQFDFQLVDVQDFNGVGESEPSPYFYQNLAEAEYCVALFMYMRLIGYPAQKISILTTYNGQKHLIRDVINTRCADNPLIGRPHKVTTVDKYQGQQNDYIILSLVRTKAVGHLRDVRRLVVAMSRARLGLYVFARVSLFENCFELTPAFQQFIKRPNKLHLVLNEMYPTERQHLQPPPTESTTVIEEMTQMANLVYSYYMGRVKAMKDFYYAQKKWDEPGACDVKDRDRMISKHPGEDRDTDSEDEEGDEGDKRNKMQVPTPIQEEPIEDDDHMRKKMRVSTPMQEEAIEDNAVPMETEEAGDDAKEQHQQQQQHQEVEEKEDGTEGGKM
ncbi:PREDICTED: intron-binding protein aquarius isoform X2 [Nicrophorus vespilloides]|uniref:Intron-binding protein aquarius isoform X2 n=1 Tax=Nicrophorus vespilloides TaxID=110193 RepID=A0ABM1M1V2_NICVS|nr:PREDICTED: intron-binding protein aquarius isoform X2 [Nicrophorus vespilloides]